MKEIRLLIVLVLAVVAVCSVLFSISKEESPSGMKEIHINFPDRALFPLDPRKIYSIGDQVISEHIFGYHARTSEFGGFLPYLSNVSINTESKSISIRPLQEIRDSAGNKLSVEEICKSLANSFSGTAHANYPDVFRGYKCDELGAEILLNYIPINFKLLLTIPDFAIFNSSQLPITGDRPVHTTGPYYFDSKLSDDSIILKRNKFFPADLRANVVDTVIFRPYDPSPAKKTATDWNPAFDHLIYFMALYVGENYVSVLKEAGYKIKISPTEGILFLNFSERVSESKRNEIALLIDRIRQGIVDQGEYLSNAYSMQSPERGFGLSKESYLKIVKDLPTTDQPKHDKKLVLGASESFYTVPLIRSMLDYIASNMSDAVELRLYKRGELERFDREVDINLEVVGLSQADPITHLFFLKNNYPLFRRVLTDEVLVEVARESDAVEFSRKVLAIEKQLASQRIYVPIAHYPGIVAESPLLESVPSLSWSWGTAAWTYRTP